jgi:hypothetical protein
LSALSYCRVRSISVQFTYKIQLARSLPQPNYLVPPVGLVAEYSA